MSDAFATHLATLYSCRLCPNVFGSPVTGAVPGARVILVGQAPGPHEVEDRRPFAYTAGKRLFSWFERFGVDENEFRSRVHMCAVIRCFPGRDRKSGGDRVPHRSEIANCAAHLDREIRLLAPKLVIAVGTLAAQQLIGVAAAVSAAGGRGRPLLHNRLIGKLELREIVGRLHPVSRAGEMFDVVVLPHPSGRSTWLNKPDNRELLERSLALITAHAGWRATFRRRKPPSC